MRDLSLERHARTFQISTGTLKDAQGRKSWKSIDVVTDKYIKVFNRSTIRASSEIIDLFFHGMLSTYLYTR